MVAKKKGFTLIELLIVVVIVGILALAAIPLISSNTEEARSSEARAALGALKDRARVVYQRTPAATVNTITGLGISTNELTGTYFTSTNYTVALGSGSFTGTCTGVYSAGATALEVTANMVSGSASFNR